MIRTIKLTIVMLAAVFALNANAGIITKAPDLGAFWNPLSPNGGTYIYANSFVADMNGSVTDLGFWAASSNNSAITAQVVLQVYGGGAAPDSTNVLAQTDLLDLALDSSLDFISAATLFSSNLVAGNQYWFAANVIGAVATGSIRAGGHTQNSGGIVDNGTFWFSNDPTGINFDGQNRTPEMALQVQIGNANAVPEPTTLSLLGLTLAGLGWSRRKSS